MRLNYESSSPWKSGYPTIWLAPLKTVRVPRRWVYYPPRESRFDFSSGRGSDRGAIRNEETA